MEMETLKITFEKPDVISIDLRDNKPCSSNVVLTDFVEIKSKYLRLLKNTWIKYKDNSGDFYSGGFLIDVSEDYVSLRNIQQKIFNVEKSTHIFYCKSNTENYLSVQEIIIERQKLSREKFLFNQEKIKFNQYKKEFFRNNNK